MRKIIISMLMLFIAWQTVLNLGEQINNNKPNFSLTLSPDGKYLFYTNGEDIYWVSTEIIEELKPKEMK